MAVAVLGAAWGTAGADVGRTPESIWHSVGGVGEEESARIATDSVDHALSLRLAARGSGAYLADVDLRIVDSSKHGHRSAVMHFPVSGEVRPFREEQP